MVITMAMVIRVSRMSELKGSSYRAVGTSVFQTLRYQGETMRLLPLIISIAALFLSLFAYHDVQRLAPVARMFEQSQEVITTAKAKTGTVREDIGNLLVDFGQWISK